ncbi:MAG: flotillin family protein [Desulfomonile tiedjei]|uniref:Flotillin family protein n=1 Tax=Desulfomonile tiedjei TaxID=2358 RepID=A0A9D6Z4A2_9BACT|nr:flotillin family protein [Desulfomonile tiedjei]
MMTAVTLTVLLGVILCVLLWVFVGRYKRCPSNRILVIYGKTGEGAAKCVHGGAAFVWPVLQYFEWLDLEPFVVPIELTNALSQENIRVSVPTTVTAAISTEQGIMQNAAIRLLGQTLDDVRKQAQDIILGQMRAVIATMRIEEINRDRQAFMAKVNDAVSVELEKIGLSVINVNIKDIEDDSGYIKALGRKAAAEAVNQAIIDVAEQEKLGKIGVAERERDQRRAVAAANSEASVGESEAERDRRKAVAAAEASASIGEAEASRDRRQKTSVLDAQAVETEATANANKAGFQATQKVAEEGARAKAQSAAAQADATVRVAKEESEKLAEEARARREEARLNAEVVVPAEADRKKAVVNAEAQRQQKALVAKGEAEAVFARMQAEAQGAQAQLNARAEGYKALIQSCGADPSLTAALLLIEKLVELTHIQAEAIQNLPIEKMIVWDGGGDGGISDLGRRLLGVLPPMHDMAKTVGLQLPEFLGKAADHGKAEEKSHPAQKPEHK